jgi:ketosteroid isomerase-like protein
MTDRYDSFEQARAPVERLYALGNELSSVGVDSERGSEIEEEVRGLFAEDLEHVTRDGVLRGPDHFLSEWRVQLRRFELAFEVELHDGDDAVVAVGEIVRRMRESPSDYLKVRSGALFRVRDGKIVFLEGYQDGRDALRAGGVRPDRTTGT